MNVYIYPKQSDYWNSQFVAPQAKTIAVAELMWMAANKDGAVWLNELHKITDSISQRMRHNGLDKDYHIVCNGFFTPKAMTRFITATFPTAKCATVRAKKPINEV